MLPSECWGPFRLLRVLVYHRHADPAPPLPPQKNEIRRSSLSIELRLLLTCKKHGHSLTLLRSHCPRLRPFGCQASNKFCHRRRNRRVRRTSTVHHFRLNVLLPPHLPSVGSLPSRGRTARISRCLPGNCQRRQGRRPDVGGKTEVPNLPRKRQSRDPSTQNQHPCLLRQIPSTFPPRGRDPLRGGSSFTVLHPRPSGARQPVEWRQHVVRKTRA